MSEVDFDLSFVIIAVRWCHSQAAPVIKPVNWQRVES